jgi:hypothetical protein
VAHEQSAIENIKWQKAQNSARADSARPLPTGKDAIRADIQQAQGRLPAQAQARELDAAPKGKAGIRSDLYKAMQSEPQKSGPSRDGGRSR